MQRPPLSYLLLFSCFMVPLFSHAQEQLRMGPVENEVTLISQGSRKALGTENAGLALGDGDLIQTGRGSAAQLELEAGLIKVSEHTSLQFNGFGEDGSVSMELLYGRLRISTGSERELHIKTGDGVLRFGAGELSLDYIAQQNQPAARPQLRIVIFSGHVSVAPPGENTAKVEVDANEAVIMEMLSPLILVERSSLALPVVAPPLPVIAAEPPPPVIIPPDYSEINKEFRKKAAGVVMGALFITAGTVLEGVGINYLYNGNSDRAKLFLSVGAIPIGVGILTVLAALLPHSP